MYIDCDICGKPLIKLYISSDGKMGIIDNQKFKPFELKEMYLSLIKKKDLRIKCSCGHVGILKYKDLELSHGNQVAR